jgi:hypothetical protein
VTALSGGDALQRKLKELAHDLKRGGVVRVGFLEGATYPDGTSVALVASVQEFGSPAHNIPPRPFFRNMIAGNSADWPKTLATLLAHNHNDVELSLNQMGVVVADQLRQSILDLKDPPNAPATIKKKGFDDPLIDSSHLLHSVDYEVEMDK